jgi:hypothetical protein
MCRVRGRDARLRGRSERAANSVSGRAVSNSAKSAWAAVAAVCCGLLGGCDSQPTLTSIGQDYCQMQQECSPSSFSMSFDSLEDCEQVVGASFSAIINMQPAANETACKNALIEQYACVGSLSCAQYTDNTSDCVAEGNARNTACPPMF